VGSDREAVDYPEIKGYRIVGLLGEGAVGTVFKARRTDTGVSVALKVLHALGPKRRKHIARLVKEGRVMARLNHPGIVKGLDVGESGGRYYIAMELVEGKSIRDHLEAGRIFTEEETLAVAASVVRALNHAAHHGVVHRDVKPANLMLTPDGKIKITDLGLAKDAVDLSLTRSDATVGTPQYISPEQARDSQAVDLRSDIFSLGATLYHMVTGRPPFTGVSLAEIIHHVLFELEDPVERLNPAVSAPFSKLLGRMLVKDPNDRYQNYHELMADLDRVRSGRDIKGPVRRPVPYGTRGNRWRRGIGAMAVIAVFLTAIVWRPWQTPPPAPAPKPPVVRPEPKAPPTPEPKVPSPPAWEVNLERFRSELETRIGRDRTDYEAFDSVGERLNQERPRFVEQGAAAKAAFRRLEDEIRGKIERIIRGDLTAKLNELKEEAQKRLAASLQPGDFRWIQGGLHKVDERIRELPNILVIDFAAEFAVELDEIKESARARAEEIKSRMLREAEKLADKYKFVSAKKKIESLDALEIEIFHPQVRPDTERLRGKIEELRASAGESYKEAYQAFRTGLYARLASWQYKQAEMELTEFEAHVKGWQREAPQESTYAAEQTVKDRSDFLGVMEIWKLAIQRLEALSRVGKAEPVRLTFGKESSSKVIVEVEGKRYPELIKVRYLVGGKTITNRLDRLAPEDVVGLAMQAGVLEDRWMALFYFFAAQHPDCPPPTARRLFGHCKEAFGKAGGAGPRFRPLIEELERIQRANAEENEKRALRFHAEALAHFKNWEFKQARTAWTKMKSFYRDVFKRDKAYAEFWRLARLSEPLEDLKRRFPGATREHLYQQRGKPLAFRLTFEFGKNMDLTGLDFAREQWQPSPEGLVRIEQESVAVGGGAFPTTWGIKVPIQLNYDQKAVLSITVKTAEDRVMSLLGMSLGGNIAALLNLDGIQPANRAGLAPRPNQLSLWTSPARPRYPGFDAFKDYVDHFQLKSNNRPAGVDYRLRLGEVHDLILTVDPKEKVLVFRADGAERSNWKVKDRVKSFGEIEIRAWNNPVVLKQMSIEGVLLK